MKFALSEKEIEVLDEALKDLRYKNGPINEPCRSLLEKLKYVKETAAENESFIFLSAGEK